MSILPGNIVSFDLELLCLHFLFIYLLQFNGISDGHDIDKKKFKKDHQDDLQKSYTATPYKNKSPYLK